MVGLPKSGQEGLMHQSEGGKPVRHMCGRGLPTLAVQSLYRKLWAILAGIGCVGERSSQGQAMRPQPTPLFPGYPEFHHSSLCSFYSVIPRPQSSAGNHTGWNLGSSQPSCRTAPPIGPSQDKSPPSWPKPLTSLLEGPSPQHLAGGFHT